MSSRLEELRKRKNRAVGAVLGVSEEEMQQRLDLAEARIEGYRQMAAQRDAAQNPYAAVLESGQAQQMSDAEKWELVNSYKENDEQAKALREAARVQPVGALSDNPIAEQMAAWQAERSRQAKVERQRERMTQRQRDTHDQMQALEREYGALFGLGQRVGSIAEGSAKSLGGGLLAAGETAANTSAARRLNEAAQRDAAERQAVALLLTGQAATRGEDGKRQESEAYRRAAEEAFGVPEAGALDAGTLTAENSAGIRMLQEGNEAFERAKLGLDGAGRVAVDVAGGVAQNAVPIVTTLGGTVIGGLVAGPAGAAAGAAAGSKVGLGIQALAAAGQKAAEVSLAGGNADEALLRGAVSGGIEVATEKFGIDNWVDTLLSRTGRNAIVDVLKQAGVEGAEEAASYVLNYAADVAARDPEAEFSLAELLQNAGMGAAVGSIYGAGGRIAGAGVRRLTGANVDADADAQVAATEAETAGQERTLPGQENAAQDAAGQAERVLEERARAGDLQAAAELASLRAGQNEDGQTRAKNAPAAQRNEGTQAEPVTMAQMMEELFRTPDQTPAERTTQNSSEQQAPAQDAQAQAMAELFMTPEQVQQTRAAAQAARANTVQVQQAENAAQQAPAGVQADTRTAQTVQAAQDAEARRADVAGFAQRMALPEAAARSIAEDYDGQTSPAVYAKAWMDAYNAGRTGALSEEQAMNAAGSAAAVAGNAGALRTAYALGAGEAGQVYAAPVGQAARGGNVRVAEGVRSSVPEPVLQGVAARYGVDIDVVQHLATETGGEANGSWAAGVAQITLGENSGNAYQTLQHELTHYVSDVNPEGWAKFKNRVLVYASEGGQMSRLQARVVDRYEQAYGRGAVAADEAARDILAGVMSTEENMQAFCEHLAADTQTTVQEKRSILQTLRDMLDKVIETLRGLVQHGNATAGSAYGRQLAEAQDSRALVEEYLQLLDETGEARRDSGASDRMQQNTPAAASAGVEEQYSIRQDEGGRAFVEIDEDILKGVESKDVLKTVRNEIRRRYPNGFMRDGWRIELNSQGVREFLRSRSSQQLQKNRPEVFADKLRMAANLDEIIQTAEQWRSEEPKHERKDNLVGFRRGNVRIRAGKNDYNAEIVTGIKPGRREIFYDIVGVRPTTIRTPTAIQVGANDTLTPVGASRGSINENIAQERQTVNPQMTETEEGPRYSRPVRDEAQLRQEMEQAREESRRLKEERDAWEDSQEVRELKARRLQMREQMGLFGIKNWDEATPEWQRYVDRRKEYNARITQSRERADALNEELLASGRTRQEQREQGEQAAYNAEMERSGVGREEFRRRKAVAEFGTTREFGEAGYILPDGKMLDFKGEGGAKGQRGMDHRQIADAFAANELGRARTAYMNQFIADGNVRVMAEEPGVDISAETRPTDAQLEQIRKMADSLGVSRHKFGLDISDAAGKQVASRWYEGRVRGDRVVQDIREFYRTGKMPAQSETDAYRYSRADADAAQRDLARENRELARRAMRLEEQVQTLKEEFRLSEGHRMNRKAVHDLARRMVQAYESRYDVKQLEGELHRYFEYIANNPDASYEDVLDTGAALMRGVLEQSARANNALAETYKPVKQELHSMTFEVQRNSPAYHELMNALGDGEGGPSWAKVRRNTFGRVNLKLVDGPGNLDVQFAELAEKYPYVFDETQGAAENVQAALGVYEAETVYENPYGMDLDTAAENAAQELFEAYMDTPERHTYADRQDAKRRLQVQRLREQYKQRRQEALERQKEEYQARERAARENSNKWAAQMRTRIERYKKNGETGKAERMQARLDKYLDMADPRMAKALAEQQAAFDTRMQRRNEGLRWRQARDGVEKNFNRLYKMVSQPTDARHVPENLRRPVLEFLDAVNWNTHREDSAAAYKFQNALREIESLVAQAENGEGDAAGIEFDPDLKTNIQGFLSSAPKDSKGRVKINDAKAFSAVQMQRLNDILQTIGHSIANADRMLADERGRKLKAVAVQSVQEMQEKTANRLRARKPKLDAALDNAVMDRVEGWAGLDMMDAGSFFRSLGPAAESVYSGIRQGFDKRVVRLREAQDYMGKLLAGKKDAVKAWSGAKAAKQTFTTEGGDTLQLTPGQVMELYCLTQRKQAREHLTKGGIAVETRPGKTARKVKVTPTDIANIVGSLTNEQVNMAKAMQRYLSTTAASWGNETSMELYGIRKFKEQNYWPIRTLDSYNRTSDANAGGDAGLWGVKNKGMTKGVKPNANNPLVLHDVFDTWCQHIDDMATYNAWAAPLADAMRWYNWHGGNEISVKEALESLYGKKGKEYFLTFMKDVNGVSQRSSPNSTERLFGGFNRAWKVAKVGANLRVFIQQPTSYLRAGAEISPKYLTEALGRMGNIKRAMREASQYCGIAQWADWGFFETNIGQSMRSILVGDQTRLETLQEMATAPAGKLDHFTRGLLWMACEGEVRDTHPELEGEAFKQAVGKRLGEVIDRTQVVDSVLHRSQIMRSKDGLMQMEMNFMAEPTKTYNMVREALVQLAGATDADPKVSKAKKTAALKRFGRVTATWLVSALGTSAAAAIVDSWRVRDDDRDKNVWQRYMAALQANMFDNVNLLGSFPILKNLFSAAQGYDVERTDMAAFIDLYKGIDSIKKMLTGNQAVSFNQIMRKIAKPLSGVLGIPVANAWRDSKALYDALTGLTDPLNVDRNLRAEPEEVSYDDLVTQLRREAGRLAPAKYLDKLKALYGSDTGSYAEMLGDGKAEAVDSWLQALSRNTGKDGKENSSVLPRKVTNKITYTAADGNEVTEYLGGADYLEYAGQVQKTACELVYSYMNGPGKTADAAEQAGFVKDARTYAVETARAAVLGEDYQMDSWVAEVQAAGGDAAKAIAARRTVKEATGDKDADGKTISGSRTKNAVTALVEQGYSTAEARALYDQTESPDSLYLELFQDVRQDAGQADELAALFGASGQPASYAGMLGDESAAKVDSYLQDLAKSQGKDVLPDYAELFTGYKQDGRQVDVQMDGGQYIDYARQRTETAYDLMELFLPQTKKVDAAMQAEIVDAVEEYADQTAKASVSGYEPSAWVTKAQQAAGVSDGEVNRKLYEELFAREIITNAKGVKDENGRTISGSKKAAALDGLAAAGYDDAYARELYKLFG